MNGSTGECCCVEAVVSMDAKGQIVLPKDVRERAGFGPYDKLAVVACESRGDLCCVILMKTDRLGSSVRGVLGPFFKDVVDEKREKR